MFTALFVIETFCHRNILSSSQVRPHGMIRFLIQSVTKTKPTKFSEIGRDEIAEGQFCQVAPSFVDYTSAHNQLPFFSKFSEKVKEGTDSTREYLQKLGDKFRLDDLRRASQMHVTWSETIDTELNLIRGVVEKDRKYHENVAGIARAFNEVGERAGAETAPPNSKKYHDYLFKTVFHSLSGQRLNLLLKNNPASERSGVEEDKELIGVRSHSVEDWEKIKSHHSQAVTKLKEIQKKLDDLKINAMAIFTKHEIVIKTSSDFHVKWSSKDFMTKIYDSTLRNSGTGSITNTASNPTDESDTFTDSAAGNLGIYIMQLIAENPSGEFHTFLEPSGSAVETMDKLSTTLSVLYIRQKALEDATESLNRLNEKIIDVSGSNQESISKLVESLKMVLQGKTSLAQSVYRDIARYPEVYNVEIEYDGNVDLYQKYKDEVLLASRDRDAIAEIHPRINLLANVAHRVHGHMLAFIKEWEPETATNLAGEIIHNALVGPEGNKIPISIQRARVASQCLLYGRYDVLFQEKKRPFPGFTFSSVYTLNQNDLNEAEKQWCGKTHETGLEELRENVINHYVILGLEDGSSADEIRKAVENKKGNTKSTQLEGEISNAEGYLTKLNDDEKQKYDANLKSFAKPTSDETAI